MVRIRSGWLIGRGLVCCLGLVGPARASEVIRPCRAGTPAYIAAEKALSALDADIRKLAPNADPAPLAKRIESLGGQACFRLAGDPSVQSKSGWSLRTWWEDGGHTVLQGALKMGDKHPIVWVAPDARRALTLETAPAHRLVPLLCRSADDTCGRDTDGWRLRAQAALERGARIRLAERGRREAASDSDDSDNCDAYARKAPRNQRFARFRSCLDRTALRAPAFAIGRVRKPTEGWLVVSGRQGHYNFCDETRAFDLATGAAYRVASCSGLGLRSDGSVDHRATDRARKPLRERGVVSLDEIREAAWMLLQLGELDGSILTEAFGRELPDGVSAEGEDIEESLSFGGLTISSTTAQTRLSWRVTAGTGELGSGTITWPRDLNDDAEAHATELLEVAEASFFPSCPPAIPPSDLVGQGAKLSANRLDTDSKSLHDAGATLDTAWRELVRERCVR